MTRRDEVVVNIHDFVEEGDSDHTAATQRALYYADHINKLKDEIDRLKAELAEARKVPDGWKLVPVEPTDEMYKSGYEADHHEDKWGYYVMYANEKGVYRAMINTAPEYRP